MVKGVEVNVRLNKFSTSIRRNDYGYKSRSKAYIFIKLGVASISLP